MHFDDKQIFYVNFDVNRLEFDVMVYYIVSVIKEAYFRES